MGTAESARPGVELVGSFEKNLAAAGFMRRSKTEVPERVLMVFEDGARKRSLVVTVFDREGRTGLSLGYEQR